MLFFNWFWGRKGMEWSCLQGGLGLVEPWCKGSVELAYTRVIVATCFRLVFVLFSSCFRLFAVFISRWSEYGLGEDRARRAFGGRWERIRAGGLRVCRVFGRTGGGCGKGENL